MNKVQIVDWASTEGINFSGVAQYARCGEQFRRVHLGEKQTPSFALLEGTSTHIACATNNFSKRDKGKDLKPKKMVDISLNFFEEETKKPEFKDKVKVEGTEKDEVAKRAKIWYPEYLTKYAPEITPELVEETLRKKVLVEGVEFELYGTVDLTTKKTVVDYKTCAQVLSQNEADSSLQLSLYSMFTGKTDVGLTCFVKTKNPYVAQIKSTRNPASYQWALKVAKSTIEAVRLGAFPLAVPSAQSWGCSERFCGFWSSCRGRFESIGNQKMQEV